MKRMKFSLVAIVLSLGLLTGLLIYAISDDVFSGGLQYQEKEINVEASIRKTFALNDSKDIKSYSMDEVFGKKVKELSSEVHKRIISAYTMLDNEVKTGDFKAFFFLKGEDRLLIGIKHGDGTISLAEFDISTDQPVRIKTQTKQAA